VIEEDNVQDKKIHCIFEFCDNVLSNKLNHRHQLMEEKDVRNYMKQLLTCIDVLHAKMIMHRDIKPDNILIDKNGRLKIADFGLAKKASF